MRKSWRSHLKRVLLLSIGFVIPFASITAFPFGRLAFPGKHNSGRRQTSALAAPLKTDRLMTRQGISRTGSSGIIREEYRRIHQTRLCLVHGDRESCVAFISEIFCFKFERQFHGWLEGTGSLCHNGKRCLWLEQRAA